MITDQTQKRDPSTGKYITRNVIGNHQVLKEGYYAKQNRAKQDREGSPILEKKVSMKPGHSTKTDGLISRTRGKGSKRGGSNQKKRSPSVMSMTQNSSSNGGFQFTMKMKNK